MVKLTRDQEGAIRRQWYEYLSVKRRGYIPVTDVSSNQIVSSWENNWRKINAMPLASLSARERFILDEYTYDMRHILIRKDYVFSKGIEKAIQAQNALIKQIKESPKKERYVIKVINEGGHVEGWIRAICEEKRYFSITKDIRNAKHYPINDEDVLQGVIDTCTAFQQGKFSYMFVYEKVK